MRRYRITFLVFSLFVCAYSASIEHDWERKFGSGEFGNLPIKQYGNKRYLVITSIKVNFLRAMDFCENIHMNSLTIENEEEQANVEKLLINEGTDEYFWSAGSRLLDGTTWQWMTTGDNIGYTKWASGEPNGKNELCIHVNKENNNVVWKDYSCDTEKAIICERPIDERREGDVFANEQQNWNNVFDILGTNSGKDLLHFQGKNFYVSQQYKGNFYEALDYCQALNLKLASITSEEENKALYNHIRTTSAGTKFWTSGTRVLNDRSWVWLTNLNPIVYTNWGPGEPNNGNEKCLQLYLDNDKNLFWNDNDCNNVFQVICEGNADQHNFKNQPEVEEETKTEEEAKTEEEEKTEEKPSQPLVDDDKQANDEGNAKPSVGGGDGENISIILQDGRKFYFSRNVVATQSEARDFCARHKMRLADVRSAEENSVIAKILPYPVVNGPIWIDGEKEKEQWVWKSSKSPVGHFNWAVGSPKANSCLGLTTLGKYEDAACDQKRPFICESDGDENNTPKDKNDAVINVYMANNVVTKDGKTTVAIEHVSSQYLEVRREGGYHITVDNNAANC